MLKNKKVIIALSCIFVLTEFILSLVIQDVLGNSNSYVLYSSIVIACLFIVIFAERENSYVFTQLAMMMTVVADYFLVMATERKQLFGMIFFSMAQILYFLRLYFATENSKMRRVHLFV